jgi:hypothetical protein
VLTTARASFKMKLVAAKCYVIVLILSTKWIPQFDVIRLVPLCQDCASSFSSAHLVVLQKNIFSEDAIHVPVILWNGQIFRVNA